MNKVILVGNLARDPDYRTTNTGLPVCHFVVAVTRRFANQQGVREADFIDCVAWRQQADFVHRYFNKGKKIGVVGTLQTRTYQAQDGTKRYATEVSCDEIEFVDSKSQGGGQSYGGDSSSYGGSSYGGSAGYSAPAPKPAAAPTNDFAGQGFTEVDDDDQLPF